MRFTKMHGIGNDYIFIDCLAQPEVLQQDVARLARRIADRHYGVGGDGLILICPPDDPDVAETRMRMFNADGSEAEMCGNGIRCLAKYVVEEGLSDADPLRVQTGAGVLALRCEREESGRVWSVAVDMGPPTLETRLLPVEIAMLGQAGEGQYAVETLAGRFEGMFVSMGNPHFVSFLPDAEAMKQIDLAAAGPQLERHPAFPERMNVHFVRVLGREEATMLTWERGSGVTLACGTGACAVLVAGVRLGLLDRRALIHLPGGDLVISWPDDDATVSMIGPAQRICDGVWHG